MPTVGRQGKGRHVQSVLFYKAAGWTKESSKKWIVEHDYKSDGLDETDTLFRYRQVDPDDKKFRYRQKTIETKDGKPSIALVNAFPIGSRQSNAKRLERFADVAAVGDIDRDAGIIYGISVVSKGEAKGHGKYVDEIMLDQVAEKGNAKEPTGTKSRFDHPNACSRAVGTAVGRLHEFRRDQDRVRADLHLFDAAANSPDGDLRNYILDLAEEDPDAFAMSIVFKRDTSVNPDPANKGKPGYPAESDPYWLPHARVKELHHCDVVDEGAANDGLFGRPDYWTEQAEKFISEHPEIIAGILDRYFDGEQKTEGYKMADEEKVEGQDAGAEADGEEKVDGQDAGQDNQGEGDGQDAGTEGEGEGQGEGDGQDAGTEGEGEGEGQGEGDGQDAQSVKEKTDAAYDEGLSAGVDRIKRRGEKYKDPAFVIETAELSDDETKDAWIKRLETKLSKAKSGDADGTDAVDFTPEAGPEKFEDKVEGFEADGLTKGEATRKAAKEFPGLHKDYVARINKK